MIKKENNTNVSTTITTEKQSHPITQAPPVTKITAGFNLCSVAGPVCVFCPTVGRYKSNLHITLANEHMLTSKVQNQNT
jgi:hypothetical protein